MTPIEILGIVLILAVLSPASDPLQSAPPVPSPRRALQAAERLPQRHAR